ncbi:MAG: hypothetical protein JW864_18050 [Spirochaetes bacterium]|nr:hypothetical protein [Spirochaetota bacterium]
MKIKVYFFLVVFLAMILCCNDDSSITENIDYTADITEKDVDASTADSNSFTERNIYLDAIVEWNPGVVGAARAGWWGWVDDDFIPTRNDYAYGGPTGTGSGTSGGASTCVGINGSAAWHFEEGFYIYNGDGDDFTTFQDNFAWGCTTDGLCNELGHVEISEDMTTWYYNSAEEYDINPDPTQDNGYYCYANVIGLHGNNPTWANINQDMQAQEIVNGKWVNIDEVFISKDFKATDPNLGGNSFDLSTFRSKTDDSAWPDNGKMRYLRIVDDDTILDGQDYSKGWCLGTHLNSAMGINVKQDKNEEENSDN